MDRERVIFKQTGCKVPQIQGFSEIEMRLVTQIDFTPLSAYSFAFQMCSRNTPQVFSPVCPHLVNKRHVELCLRALRARTSVRMLLRCLLGRFCAVHHFLPVNAKQSLFYFNGDDTHWEEVEENEVEEAQLSR